MSVRKFYGFYLECPFNYYFYMKNEYVRNFLFERILAIYSPKRTILKNFLGEHAPEPPSKRVAPRRMSRGGQGARAPPLEIEKQTKKKAFRFWPPPHTNSWTRAWLCYALHK